MNDAVFYKQKMFFFINYKKKSAKRLFKIKTSDNEFKTKKVSSRGVQKKVRFKFKPSI